MKQYQSTYFCFSYDFTKFNSLDRKMIEEASKMIGEEIPNLMKLMPAEDKDKESDGKTMITGGIFDDVSSFFSLQLLSEKEVKCIGKIKMGGILIFIERIFWIKPFHVFMHSVSDARRSWR